MKGRAVVRACARIGVRSAAAAALAIAMASPLVAQQRQPAEGRPHQPRAQMAPGERAQVEEQFRERLSALIMRELGLTAEQARQLEQVNRQMESERAPIVRRERALRRELHSLLTATADERRIEALLAELVSIEGQRAALLDREQRALATFLRPSQRARYLALQENVRRRLQQRQMPGTRATPPRERPPG